MSKRGQWSGMSWVDGQDRQLPGPSRSFGMAAPLALGAAQTNVLTTLRVASTGGSRSVKPSYFYTDDTPGIKVSPVSLGHGAPSLRFWMHGVGSPECIGSVIVRFSLEPLTKCQSTESDVQRFVQIVVLGLSCGFIMFVAMLHIVGKVCRAGSCRTSNSSMITTQDSLSPAENARTRFSLSHHAS